MDFWETYLALCEQYGRSAATTYHWLRFNCQPAWFALKQMRRQIAELGVHYPGGTSCAPYRKARING